jgi:hypothetical protein
MNKKITIFGIGAILCVLLFSSVFSVPAKATTDDSYKQELWVDWVNDYSSVGQPTLYGSELDGGGFYQRMRSYGCTNPKDNNGNDICPGCYGNNNANPSHFIVAPNENKADTYADIAYFAGHGFGAQNGAGFVFNTFDSCYGTNNVWDDYDGWGDYDLEWLTLSACSVLGPDKSSAMSHWNDNIIYPHHLHVINGYQTLAYQYYGQWQNMRDSRGEIFADYLFSTGNDVNGKPYAGVGNAWQHAAYDDAQLYKAYGGTNHHTIVVATIAAIMEQYVGGSYIGSTEYFYYDKVTNPLPDAKYSGNVQYWPSGWYYTWTFTD